MKISYKWLQTYFDTPLPSPEELSAAIGYHLSEIEGTDKVGDDTVFDIKVLADRNRYLLCHEGIANEIAAILKTDRKPIVEPQFTTSKTPELKITVEKSDLCDRYFGRRIETVSVGETPTWLTERLTAVGQRSINAFVDAANFVMLDMEQPLHVFDADRVSGNITVRMAREGETITTLDGKEVKLTPAVLVIADDAGPLAIAGIKGGKRAEVTVATKRVIIESAHFDASYIRRTSTAIGIRTDSSKRFENDITGDFARRGMDQLTALLLKLGGKDAVAGEIVEISSHTPTPRTFSVNPKQVADIIGIELSEADTVDILKRLRIGVEKAGDLLKLTIPLDRGDLNTVEDIAEDVGRIYGYEKIPATVPPKLEGQIGFPKDFYYEEKLRNFLIGQGYSEIFTSSFDQKGEIEIANPLASDKAFLRSNLTENMIRSMHMNVQNAPVLGLDAVRAFEIGKVFKKSATPTKENSVYEYTSLCAAVRLARPNKKIKINDIIRDLRDKLVTFLGAESGVDIITMCTVDDTGGLIMLNNKQIGTINAVDGLMELNLSEITAVLSEPNTWDLPEYRMPEVTYKKLSQYPFVLRDIAVFVPAGTSSDELLTILKEKGGPLLGRTELFDVFTKKFPDGSEKTSYAFSMVFQSYEKTLSDAEVNPITEEIAREITKKGWTVR